MATLELRKVLLIVEAMLLTIGFTAVLGLIWNLATGSFNDLGVPHNTILAIGGTVLFMFYFPVMYSVLGRFKDVIELANKIETGKKNDKPDPT